MYTESYAAVGEYIKAKKEVLALELAAVKLKLDLIKKYPEDENRIRKVVDHMSDYGG